jgi:hypothetical protein
MNYSESYVSPSIHTCKKTGKAAVRTHNVVYVVQYTDINLPMEYTAFLCSVKVKMEINICRKCLVSVY